MLDAATMKFPYFPTSGYTEQYLDSKEYIHVEMAERLDDLSTMEAPVGVLLTGRAGVGKSTMMRELRDIARRRHGGYPTLELEVRQWQSIFKSMADQMLAHLTNPEFGQRDLGKLRTAISKVGELATGEAAGNYQTAEMHDRLWHMALALKAQRLAFVLLVDDVEMVSRLDLANIAHCAQMTQREGLPLMFVLAGTPKVFRTLSDIRDDAGMVFSQFEIKRQR